MEKELGHIGLQLDVKGNKMHSCFFVAYLNNNLSSNAPLLWSILEDFFKKFSLQIEKMSGSNGEIANFKNEDGILIKRIQNGGVGFYAGVDNESDLDGLLNWKLFANIDVDENKILFAMDCDLNKSKIFDDFIIEFSKDYTPVYAYKICGNKISFLGYSFGLCLSDVSQDINEVILLSEEIERWENISFASGWVRQPRNYFQFNVINRNHFPAEILEKFGHLEKINNETLIWRLTENEVRDLRMKFPIQI